MRRQIEMGGIRAALGLLVRVGPRAAGLAGLVSAALLLTAAAAGVAWGAGDSCRPGVLERVQAAYQSLSSFAGEFLQQDRRVEGGVESATGKISYRKPGQMHWSYDPPYEQIVVTDGKNVWLYDPLLDNVTVQPLRDSARGTPLAFLLGAGRLTEDFTCRPFTLAPPEDELDWLELLPRKSIAGLAFIQMGIRPEDSGLSALRMVDGEGNIRLMRFSKLRIGAQFPPDFFTFKITEGMEVITK